MNPPILRRVTVRFLTKIVVRVLKRLEGQRSPDAKRAHVENKSSVLTMSL